MCGQVKVVVKIESEDDMLVLQVTNFVLHTDIVNKALSCTQSTQFILRKEQKNYAFENGCIYN